MSSREFLRWVDYFRRKDKADFDRTEKIEWYLAALCYYVFTSDLPRAEAKKHKIADFVLFGPTARRRKAGITDTKTMFAAMDAAFRRMGGKGA